MTSFIVIAKKKEKRLAYVKDYCSKLTIDPFDITFIKKEETSKNISSIGIEDVKNMQKKIFLRPIRSQTKAIIIEDSHLLTTEAQNALLKVLEEPPSHTIIILSAESKETFLPTIISRCQLIELEEDKIELTPKELLEYTEFIKKLPTLSLGECLKRAEVMAKEKEKAVDWIGKLILVLRDNLVKDYASNKRPALKTQTIREVQSLHTLLETTNVNPRFAIEDAFLRLMEYNNKR